MGEDRGVYRVLLGKPEGRRQLGRLRHRWVDNIRMDVFMVVFLTEFTSPYSLNTQRGLHTSEALVRVYEEENW